MSWNYSQADEDLWIMENLVLPAKGTFCEVGAYDGVEFSNTLAFEQAGWTGILIEPDPVQAGRCSLLRSNPTWCCAVGLDEGHAAFNVNADDGKLSGLSAAGRPIPVLVKRLDWLLEASGIKHLDLLSIDTEGTELDVYESLGCVRPRIIVIEYLTGFSPSRAAEITVRLAKDGYRVAHRTSWNLILIHHA